MTTRARAAETASKSGDAVLVLPALREWETRTFENVYLTAADRELIGRIGDGGSRRLQIDELRTGIRVQTRSWVGVVRLETVEIRIKPKLAGDHLGLVRLLQVVSNLDRLQRLDGDPAIDATGDSLLDLLALLFAEATNRVLRRGILSDYREHEDELAVVRGRILGDRQILKRHGRLDRIICRFDELEHDVDENRLLTAALRAAARRVRTPHVYRKLERSRAVLESVCDPNKLDLRSARRGIVYNRLNAHYEVAHSLAWLILDALGIEDLLALGSARCFSFLLDMNRLFERFVEVLVGSALGPADYQLDSQAVQSSIIWDAIRNSPYARVIPDLLVRKRGGRGPSLAIDAKYKLYDERGIDSGDIYQTFLYAYALGQGNEERKPTALLVYPASRGEQVVTELEIRPRHAYGRASIVGLGIPIPSALDELEAGSAGPVHRMFRELVDRSFGTVANTF